MRALTGAALSETSEAGKADTSTVVRCWHCGSSIEVHARRPNFVAEIGVESAPAEVVSFPRTSRRGEPRRRDPLISWLRSLICRHSFAYRRSASRLVCVHCGTHRRIP